MARILDLFNMQQSPDDYYKNMANDAMVQGQQAENVKQAQQEAINQAQMEANKAAANARIAQIAMSLPEYDLGSLDLGRRLVAAKTAYDQAAGDLEEQQRQHEYADYVRQYGKDNGIDLSAYDNANAGQAQNIYSVAMEAARRKHMNAETPDELYSRRRNELIANGVSEKRAMDQAAREMQEYRARYNHATKNLFYDQGTSNNAIDNTGAYALASLMESDPNTAALLGSIYAHPVDNYNLDAWTQKAVTTADLADRSSVLRNNLSMERDNNNFNNQRIMNNEEFERALNKLAFTNQLNQESAAAARQGQIQGIKDMVDLRVNILGEAPDVALANVLRASGGGGSSKGKSTDGLNEEQIESLNTYDQREAEVENILRSGEMANKGRAQAAIYRLEEAAAVIDSWPSGKDKKLSEGIKQRIDGYKAAYEKMFGESFGSEDESSGAPAVW